MAKKLHKVQVERDWDADSDIEVKDDVLNIWVKPDVTMMDMMLNCKYVETAYRRFRKAVAQAMADGLFGEYDIVQDLMSETPDEFDEEYANPMTVCYDNAMRDLEFVFSYECLDDGLWYVWLNVRKTRMDGMVASNNDWNKWVRQRKVA